MPSTSFYNNYGKTFKKPRRPFEKERLDAEMKLLGEFGLRAKREIWRVQMALSKIRTAARTLLTMDEKDPKRIFEGEALLRRMYRYGLLVRRCSRDQATPRLRWRGWPKPCSLGFQPAAPGWRRRPFACTPVTPGRPRLLCGWRAATWRGCSSQRRLAGSVPRWWLSGRSDAGAPPPLLSASPGRVPGQAGLRADAQH